MWFVFKAKTLKGNINQAIVIHKTSSNLSITTQLIDVFADVALWDGAGFNPRLLKLFDMALQYSVWTLFAVRTPFCFF